MPNGDSIRLGKEAAGLSNIALGIGVVGIVLSMVLGGGFTGAQFQHSYLAAYMWGLSIALGALWWIGIQHLVNARWSIVVRRVGELLAQVLLIMAVLALPIVVPAIMGDTVLYKWVDPHWLEANHLGMKEPYLNTGFFTIRMVLYFVFFMAMANYWFNSSKRQDKSKGDVAFTKKLQSISAPTMILFAITLTFLAVDLLMTLDPLWFSTIFGVYYFATCVLTFHSTLALALMWLQSKGHLKKSVTTEHYHDIGKMMFAFVCFWTYIAFSQYMLIWYANIPEESHWYHDRMTGSWLNTTIALAAVHFVIPFFGMMSRSMKRHPKRLGAWAVYLLIVCWFDMYWLVSPNLHEVGLTFHVADFAAWAGIAGIVVWFSLLRARNVNLVPTGDPRLPRSLAFENI